MIKNASAKADAAGPRQVVFIDVEDPLPHLTANDRYASAMVVGRKAGSPLGAIDVDLTQEPEMVRARLDELVQLVELAGTLSDDTVVPDAEMPSISVVVPTIVGRSEDLELLLDAFSRVEYPRVEYILVDNRPIIPESDPLPSILLGKEGIRVVRERRPGISAARNAGVAAATGDIIVFTDDDVRVDPSWLRAIGKRFALDPSIEAVTGLILPAELETPAQIWFEHYYGGFSGARTFSSLMLTPQQSRLRLLRGSRIGVRDSAGSLIREFPVYGVGGYGAGANMAFRRSALERLGGFDFALGTGTPARGGEDLSFLISILWTGGKIAYEPKSVVHHKHRREVSELVHQLRGNGLGFTAMLTSLVIHDRRHLIGLLSQLPLAVRKKATQSLDRLRGITAAAPTASNEIASNSYPRGLVVHELRGYAEGPWAYLKSRKVARSRSSTTGSDR